MFKAITATVLGYLVFVTFGVQTIGEYHYRQFNLTGNREYLLKAVYWDKNSTLYNVLLASSSTNGAEMAKYIENASQNNNGDVTGWSLYTIKGKIAIMTGNIMEGIVCYNRALSYNPFDPTLKQQVAETNNIISKHDKIMVKFR